MIFLPNPDGDIANVATFHDGFYFDNQPYRSRLFFPMPSTDDLDRIFYKLNESDYLSDYSDDNHFVIHQINASWVGSGIDRFHEELTNQKERYRSIEGYDLEKYKCESAILIAELYGGDYLTLNVDPWSSGEEIRHLEVVLFVDGIPLNNDRIERLMEATGLEFSSGEKWEYAEKVLRGKAVSDIEVQISERYENDWGEVVKVLCENPLWSKHNLLSRFFPKVNNIVADYKYIIADCEPTMNPTDTGSVERITISDYEKVGRHLTQNISMTVSL